VTLNPVATELTTGATDALLALLAAGGARWVGRHGLPPSRAAAWSFVFWLLAAASALGAVAHGLDLTAGVRAALWHPLFLLLGLVVAAFLVAALHDLRGDPSARRWRWPLLAVGAAFYGITVFARGAFVVFVAYEAIAMLLALAAYVALAARRRLPGAGWIAAGIVLDLAAAGVQASTLSWSLGVPLDHNGLFHVVQGVALLVMLRGIGAGRAVSASGSP
jgi:hypothetical protein